MKRISFFSVIKTIIYSTSLLLIMSIFSFVLVSLLRFNHQKDVISYQNIEIYKEEDIESFNGYIEDNLYLIIKMKKAQSNEYLIDYAYHYYFIYQTLVYLEVDNVDDIKYVNIDINGLSTIV